MIAKKRKKPTSPSAFPELKLVVIPGTRPLLSRLSRAENFLWWLGDRIPWPTRTRYFFAVSLVLCLALLPDRNLFPYALNGAFGLTALFSLLYRYGLDGKTASARALALAVGTPWLVYAKADYSESFVASALLACALVAESSAVIAGLLGGVALAIRPEMLIWLPLLAFSFSVRGEDRAKFAFGVFPGLVFFLWSNFFREGHLLPVGFREWNDFSTPLYVGLYGQLFSSGKSLFLYAPVLLLFPTLVYRHFRASRSGNVSGPMDRLILWSTVLAVAHLIVFGLSSDWAGQGGWGPRHLIPAILFCAATVATSRTLNVRAFYALCALGLFLQLPALLIGPQRIAKQPDNERTYYNPRYSPIVSGFERLKEVAWPSRR